MDIPIYSQEGKEIEKIEVSKDVFGVPVKEDLIHRVLVMQLSNARQAIAHTKKRDEVHGSTKKITRQKGLGRARKGQISSPVMRKGGVAFGPRNTRNFKKDLSVSERRAGLFCALSAKMKDNSIFGLDTYTGEMSTKAFSSMLSTLPIDRNVLIVLSDKNELVQKSSRNLPTVKTILVNYLNVRDLLKYRSVMFMKDAIQKVESIFLKK